ncbi:T4O12.12 [Pyrus ussuriensis x Pyrus communis]|uniref:T4O12.12 n=1 Tax=Pyrus ussuriensis x Pyrus communis TaxID=2448454 RepID=A0A5N5HNQ2_9ROSA|nr:T4O12.12 [Pyrus ussuriensis x Pyrus communis]
MESSSSSSCPSQLLSSRLILCVCVVVFGLFQYPTATEGLVKLPPNQTVPAVIVFGDSIMDTGNNNDLESLVRCNFPPYGLDFQQHKPTGRFGNGKVPSDLIASELGIREYLPAYLDPNLRPQDLPTGVVFASGGTGFDPMTPQIVSAISMDDQLKMFKEYIGKLKGVVGEERTKFILSKALVLVVAGSDDIANTYFGIRIRQAQYSVPAYTDLMVNSASSFVKELYKLGVRRIGVFSAPPIGCVPSQRTLGGGILRGCAEEHNDAAKLFNIKLSSSLNSLSSALSGSKIIYVDVYNPLLDIILNPAKYGFKVVEQGCCGTGIIELPENVTVPAIIIFGDSIVDTGNNNENFKTYARSNFLPYGKDLKGGMPTGRYSNGKVPSDFIAESFGIKELLPAYLDPTLQPNDLLTGVVIAAGGAGYDPLTAKLAAVASLSDQLKQFKEYIEKLKGIVGEEKTNFIIKNSVIFVVAGSNDISNTYFLSGARKLEYDVPSYTDFMVKYASDFIKDLYGLGVRRIAVLSIPPIGCVPSQRTVKGGIGRDCDEAQNQASQLFNSKLSAEMDRLQKNLSNSRVAYVDMYNMIFDLITNPAKHGFEVVNKGCCGTGLIEVTKLCNQLQPAGVCTDDSKYFFWDSYHPTERAYKIIVNQMLDKYASRFF